MLTATEAGKLLGLSADEVMKLVRELRIPHYRFGPRTVRFDRGEVIAHRTANAKAALSARGLRVYRDMLMRVPESERGELPALTSAQLSVAEKRLRRQRMPPWANGSAIRAIYAEARRRTLATGVQHEVDHEIPLLGELVSGLHVETNLRIITAVANRRKGNKCSP